MTICVYCGSNSNVDHKYLSTAAALGREIAGSGCSLVNGAGSEGLMAACGDAVRASGGKVTGVIPQFMIDNGWCSDNLDETIATGGMHDRQRRMMELSDGMIALPGGVGTMYELLEAITWKQLRLHDKPIVILNQDGYYDSLIRMLEGSVAAGFVRKEQSGLWLVADDPREAVRLIARHARRPDQDTTPAQKHQKGGKE